MPKCIQAYFKVLPKNVVLKGKKWKLEVVYLVSLVTLQTEK